MPRAMVKSKPEPSFLMSAGARLMVMCVSGISYPTVPYRRSHPVAALAHRRVGQSDRMEMVFVALNTGNVDFNFNNAGVNSVDGGAEGFVEHRCEGTLRASTLLLGVVGRL